jgi:hypothetical protein
MTRVLIGAIGLALWSLSAASADTTMTFEEFLGQDTAPIATYYSGITFQSGSGGSDWVARDATTGIYNISSWPSGQQWGGAWYWIHGYVGATTALDYTGNDGIIAFDNKDATYVQLAYCSGSDLNLLAYDSGGNLIDQDVGPANRRYVESNESGPGTLRVDWDGSNRIAYVNVHDTGNFWVVDNVMTDATGIIIRPVPAPGAFLLGTMGAGVVGWLRRRKAVV